MIKSSSSIYSMAENCNTVNAPLNLAFPENSAIILSSFFSCFPLQVFWLSFLLDFSLFTAAVIGSFPFTPLPHRPFLFLPCLCAQIVNWKSVALQIACKNGGHGNRRIRMDSRHEEQSKSSTIWLMHDFEKNCKLSIQVQRSLGSLKLGFLKLLKSKSHLLKHQISEKKIALRSDRQKQQSRYKMVSQFMFAESSSSGRSHAKTVVMRVTMDLVEKP